MFSLSTSSRLSKLGWSYMSSSAAPGWVPRLLDHDRHSDLAALGQVRPAPVTPPPSTARNSIGTEISVHAVGHVASGVLEVGQVRIQCGVEAGSALTTGRSTVSSIVPIGFPILVARWDDERPAHEQRDADPARVNGAVDGLCPQLERCVAAHQHRARIRDRRGEPGVACAGACWIRPWAGRGSRRSRPCRC